MVRRRRRQQSGNVAVDGGVEKEGVADVDVAVETGLRSALAFARRAARDQVSAVRRTSNSMLSFSSTSTSSSSSSHKSADPSNLSCADEPSCPSLFVSVSRDFCAADLDAPSWARILDDGPDACSSSLSSNFRLLVFVLASVFLLVCVCVSFSVTRAPSIASKTVRSAVLASAKSGKREWNSRVRMLDGGDRCERAAERGRARCWWRSARKQQFDS